jgi:hypothetical protein
MAPVFDVEAAPQAATLGVVPVGEQKVPSGVPTPPLTVPLVTVWCDPAQTHCTVSPGWIVTVEGEKVKLLLGPTVT